MEVIKAFGIILISAVCFGIVAVFAFLCWLLTNKDLDPNNEENDQNF
jgi:hypothetical protein